VVNYRVKYPLEVIDSLVYDLRQDHTVFTTRSGCCSSSDHMVGIIHCQCISPLKDWTKL
jgi:hypothetical protein